MGTALGVSNACQTSGVTACSCLGANKVIDMRWLEDVLGQAGEVGCMAPLVVNKDGTDGESAGAVPHGGCCLSGRTGPCPRSCMLLQQSSLSKREITLSNI
eukprot:1435545-Amphidinium_carterae.3